MHFGRRAPVHIERNAEFLEGVLDDFMITVYHVLRRDALLLGPDGDGHAMLVRTADEKHVLLLQTEVTHVNVRRDIHPCQMTDMHRTVGVWQSDVTVVLLNFFSIFYIFSNYILHCRVLDKPLTLGRSKRACPLLSLNRGFHGTKLQNYSYFQVKPSRQVPHVGHLITTIQQLAPVILRLATRNLGKQTGKLCRTVNADPFRDLCYRHIGGQQQGLRPFDTPVLYIKAGGRAHHLFEYFREMPRRQTSPVCQLGQRDMPVQMAVDIVHNFVELATGCRSQAISQALVRNKTGKQLHQDATTLHLLSGMGETGCPIVHCPVIDLGVYIDKFHTRIQLQEPSHQSQIIRLCLYLQSHLVGTRHPVPYPIIKETDIVMVHPPVHS